jgi:endonuclease YncB( thermonuclease family)
MMEWEPEMPPPTPPRPHPAPRRVKESPSSPNLQESHPDHIRHSPPHPGTSPTPEEKLLKPEAPQVVKMHTQIEQHLVKRRHHRHVAPWVVGVFPNAPYSLGWYVDQVLSGNTIRVINPANQSQIVQLHGVAAPAQGQAFFDESKNRLAEEIEHQTVYVVDTFDHLDGSFTGKIFLGSEYVNRTQIAEGMGCYDAEQGIDTDLAEAEIAAQEGRRGIWGNPDLVSEMAYAD